MAITKGKIALLIPKKAVLGLVRSVNGLSGKGKSVKGSQEKILFMVLVNLLDKKEG